RFSKGRGAIEIRVADALTGAGVLRALGLEAPCPEEVRLASRVLTDPAAFAQVTLAPVLLPLLFGAVGFVSRTHPVLCALLGAATLATVAFVLVALTAPTSL